jgi:hypothetical protein
MDECTHTPPETCAFCGSIEVVVSVDDVGACLAHIDDVFEQAAVPLKTLLAAAIEAFGNTEEHADAP